MVAPTPTVSKFKSGDLVVANWSAIWTDSTQLTDSIVVDISADSPTGSTDYEILRIYANMSAGIQFTLEFDATTDSHICASALGATYMEVDFEYKGMSPVRDPKAAGTTGDILITTLSAASGDEISLTIVARAHS